jgi:uncharacterized protein with von Willebrand factor type A (vWA) domain
MMLHATGFDPDALDAPLAPLDDLPRGLWLPGITNSVGTLPPRLQGLTQLRRQLITGEMPQESALPWPLQPVAGPFLERIARLRLPEFCLQRDDVADQVLRVMLWHCDRIVDYLDECDPDTAAGRAADAFFAEWEQMAEEISEVLFVFDDLGDALKFNRWDETRGLLRTEGWRELVRIRRLLEDLSELREVIRHLGRARETDDPDESSLPETSVMEEVRQLAPQLRETRVPDLPAETRGIQRSGRIARMLPSESVMMCHPRLRLSWFARHAERALLTYEDDDTLRETVLVEARAWRPSPRPTPARKLVMGPMIVCVDTSGSMQGGAEQVAKAAVLEAMRVAHAQQRNCYVYAFSGPEDIVEQALTLDPEGIRQMLSFLGQSFHGGTDVGEPLARAVERLRQDEWHLADLLLATDGEFGVPREIAARVSAAKQDLGLRVQGVLIGDRETIGMLEICDDVFWVRDWRRFGSGAELSENMKGLTARYFPGALRHNAEDRPAREAADSVLGRTAR